MENSTMLNAMIQRVMTEESFLDRIGMSEQEMKTFLKEQNMREICVPAPHHNLVRRKP